MSPESSPFTPGQRVPIEFFVGRVREIERLRSLVRAAARGKFKIGFVTGERGIGKTSLVSFVRHLSEKDDRVAGAHVFLGGAKDVPDMIRRTLDRLLKENVEKPWYGKRTKPETKRAGWPCTTRLAGRRTICHRSVAINNCWRREPRRCLGCPAPSRSGS